MALQDKGFEVALNGIKTATTKMRLYGEGDNAPGQAQTFGSETITWNDPSDASGTWRLVTSATSPCIFEFEASDISAFSGSFEAIGIDLLDASNNIIMKKAFASPFTFDVPGQLTVEQVIIEAS